MSVNLEQIEILKERANISYGEARELLEKCNNDVVEALIYLESQAKLAPPKNVESEMGFGKAVKKLTELTARLIKKGNETRFVIRKSESPVIDLPVTIVILSTVVVLPLTVGGVLLAMVTGHKIRFIKQDGEGMEINKALDKISSTVNSAGSQVAEAIKKN